MPRKFYDEPDYDALVEPEAWASPAVWRRHHRAVAKAQATPLPEMMEARHGKPAEGMEWYYINGDTDRPAQRPKRKPGPRRALSDAEIEKRALERREAVYDPDGTVAVYAREDDKFVAIRRDVKNSKPVYEIGRPKRNPDGSINFRKIEEVLCIVSNLLAIKRAFIAQGDVDVEGLRGHPRIDYHGKPFVYRPMSEAEAQKAWERGDITIGD